MGGIGTKQRKIELKELTDKKIQELTRVEEIEKICCETSRARVARIARTPSTRVLLFCCHKCHTMGKWMEIIGAKWCEK